MKFRPILSFLALLVIATVAFNSCKRGIADDANFTEEQTRALLLGAVIPMVNTGVDAALRFSLPKTKPAHARNLLADSWDITGREQTLGTMSDLAVGNGQGSVANDIFDLFIRNGIEDELTTESLYDFYDYFYIDDAEYLWQSSINRAVPKMEEYMQAESSGEDEPENVLGAFAVMVFVDMVNNGIAGYSVGMKFLESLGYTRAELSAIDDFRAWDYGRTGTIGRYGALAGFVESTDAWPYMTDAANNAAKIYNDWRQFAAAYFLGRCLAFSAEDLDDFRDVADYLINDDDSPFKQVPFR